MLIGLAFIGFAVVVHVIASLIEAHVALRRVQDPTFGVDPQMWGRR